MRTLFRFIGDFLPSFCVLAFWLGCILAVLLTK